MTHGPVFPCSVWAPLLAWVCACSPLPTRAAPPGRAGGAEALSYTVTFVREPEPALEVEILRVHDEAPRRFLFTQPGVVSEVRLQDERGRERAPVTVTEEGEVFVPGDTRTLRYVHPLGSRARGGAGDLFTGIGQGGDWQAAGRSWLLRPYALTPGLRARLVVRGADALLPWAPDAGGVYHVAGEDLVDSGFLGLGGRRCTVEVPGARVEVAVLGRTSRVDDAAVCAWIHQAATEVLTVRRTFPYPRVTVRVIPVPRSAEAGRFGLLLWSSPPSLSLLLGQDVTPDAFQEDWVAVHELLHTTHPTFEPATPWLSEGIATYFTEVARARSGRHTPERAWAGLVDGFARGREAVGPRTMEDVATRQDSYLGTYWTGALFALHLDVELRRATQGAGGLETVLERLTAAGSTSSVEGFGRAVDAVAGRPLFQALLARHWRRPAFADQGALLKTLGVVAGAQGVKLENAPDSRWREAVVGRRPMPVRK